MTAHAAKILPPETNALTPMMRQYLDIKAANSDAIVFYRLGDFYEMFFEDAVQASKLLDLTLTSRGKNDDNPVPMCGVPYHASESYIAKLVALGRKVVVCEQTEDPKFAKGIVRREVTRVITPGTVHETESLDSARHNFLLALTRSTDGYAGAACDVSTGKLEYFRVPADKVGDEIARLDAREVLYPEALRDDANLTEAFATREGLYHHAMSDLLFDPGFAADTITQYYRVATTAALDLDGDDDAASAIGALLAYLRDNKLLKPDLIAQPTRRPLTGFMLIDASTLAHLEIFRTERDGKRHGTLVWHLDQCATPMGSRTLADMLRAPLMDTDAINERLSAVGEFVDKTDLSETLAEKLALVNDLERLANRFVLRTATPRDAVSLAASLERLPEIRELLDGFDARLIKSSASRLRSFADLTERIRATIREDAPVSIKDGGIIRDGVNAELDELRAIERSGKDFILEMERRERERTGIGSLKIRYNNVFGYYIEITNAHRDKTPAGYIRKQTLANAERYITDELKNYEAKVLGAGERIRTLESDLFSELSAFACSQVADIKDSAAAVGLVDVLNAFAAVSRRHHYARPRVTTDIVLDLRGARHPILERLFAGDRFVPNDILLDAAGASEIIITGPNMAGKSTLMRMTALIAVMGQIGCFVPCDKAVIGVADRIFTRVGAHDNLKRGLSTFMVEMVETARILREATPKSLIFLDEIGRGTSTFDGLSIAWAVAEDIHDRLRARTLFATHYHELCDLSQERKGIRNFHMAVKEWNGEIIFLRKLASGGTNRSYGVVVAGMAGLPTHVIKKAKDVLKLLELKDLSFQKDMSRESASQPSLFEPQDSDLARELKKADVNAMTPLEALNFLAELKGKYGT